jgi:hypothetical protein
MQNMAIANCGLGIGAINLRFQISDGRRQQAGNSHGAFCNLESSLPHILLKAIARRTPSPDHYRLPAAS